MDDDPIPTISVDEVTDDPMAEYTPSIFTRRELLRPTYVPDMARIVGRDAELEKLEEVLKPACHGEPPGDAAIISKPGTGKTLCTKNVVGRVRALAKKHDFRVVTSYVNCGEDTTETQVARSLAGSANRQLGEPTRIPSSGIAAGSYFKKLWTLVNNADAFIVVLDEIDKLGDEANHVLKKLSDAESDGKACYIGSVVISNKTGFYSNLDPRVQSRFQNNDTELIFGPYDAKQLQDILENRHDAFNDGVLDEDVIPLCAAYAAQEHGDARKALDMLLAAGTRAQRTDAARVTTDDVRAVHDEAAANRERELIATSVEHAQYTLFALAQLDATEEASAFRTGEIYGRYQQVCDAVGRDPQAHNTVLNHLKKWAEVELTENEHTGGGKGRGSYREHSLLLDADVVLTAVRNETFNEPVFDE